MPPLSFAAPSLALLVFSASLAASSGAALASTHSPLSPLYLRDPRLAPQSSAFPSFAGWASTGPTYGCRAAAGPSALPQASSGPHATPLALLLLRIPLLALRFLLRLRSLVRCGSLCGPQPVALWSLNVRRSILPACLIVFPPGFCLTPLGCMFGLRLYITVRRLSRLFLPGEGGRCVVADAPLPRRPRLCPSWLRLQPPPRGYYDRSLCFFWLFVLCVSQPKMSRGVVLYGHRKCRVPLIPPEFILALSRTLSLSSDL